MFFRTIRAQPSIGVVFLHWCRHGMTAVGYASGKGVHSYVTPSQYIYSAHSCKNVAASIMVKISAAFACIVLLGFYSASTSYVHAPIQLCTIRILFQSKTEATCTRTQQCISLCCSLLTRTLLKTLMSAMNHGAGDLCLHVQIVCRWHGHE